MTNDNKKDIQKLLKSFIEQHQSQAKAVAHIKNASEATIIAIRNGNWENVSDTMFRKVGKQIGWNPKGEWNMVPTRDFNALTTLFEDAQENANVYGICANEGTGKSGTAVHYAKTHANVFHISCAEYFNRKQFLQKIMESMGKDSIGMNASECMDEIVSSVLKMNNPLILLDEADKLKDESLRFFITFYNFLEDKCGMVLMATDVLEKKIRKGVRIKKTGFKEIYSRLGRKFVCLKGTNMEEVASICNANGMTDPQEISYVFNNYEGDLRRLKRLVHATNMRNSAQKPLKSPNKPTID